MTPGALKDYQDMEARVVRPIDNNSKGLISSIIFKVAPNEKDIVTESIQLKSSSPDNLDQFERVDWVAFCRKIEAIKEPRYAVVDVFYRNKTDKIDEEVKKQLVLRWSPDGAVGKFKMMYSSGEGTFKEALKASKVYQANDGSDFGIETVRKFVRL